jgi:serine/threonine-protein kinase
MSQILLKNRYKVITTVASGGFGKIFLAEDNYRSSGERCAIKQLKPVAQNPKIQNLINERFQKEAEILAALGESNSQIPKLYDYFTEDGQFYLVQEWIEGETLNNLVKFEGILPEAKVKNILISILSTLDYIHSNKIIHRDIKPNNIIVRFSDALPVLIDFGAVKETMRTTIDPEGNLSSSIIVGTPGYMPSEQAIGRPVYSSDLYALGLVGIYLLTGKMPQDLETDPYTGEIVWHQYSSELSSSLVTIIDRSIRYHPRDRFSTASEMLVALEYKESSLFLITLPPKEAEITKRGLTTKITSAQPQIVVRQKPSSTILRTNSIKKGLLGSSLAFSAFLTPAFQSVIPPTAPISQIPQTVKNTPTPQATPTPIPPTVSASAVPASKPTVQTSSTAPVLSSQSTSKNASTVQSATKPVASVTKVQSNSTSKAPTKTSSSGTPVSSNSTTKTTTNTPKPSTKPPSTVPTILKSSKNTTTAKTPSTPTSVSSNSTTRTTTNTPKPATKPPSTVPAIFKSSKSTTTTKTPSTTKTTTNTPKPATKSPSTVPAIFKSSKSKTTTSSKPTPKAPSTKISVSRSSQTAPKPTVRSTSRTQTTSRSTARVARTTARKEVSKLRESKVEVRKERREDRSKEMRKETREGRKKRD